jgi:hypothetical protein
MTQPDVPRQILVSGLDVLDPMHYATLAKQLGAMGLDVSVPELADTTTSGESVVSSNLDLENPPELPSLADFTPDLGSEYIVPARAADGSPRALISTRGVRRFSDKSGLGQRGSHLSPFMYKAMLSIYGKPRFSIDQERTYKEPEHLENDLWLSSRDGRPTVNPAILVGAESFLRLLHAHEEGREYLRPYGPTTRGIVHYFMQAINLGPAAASVAES